jgi:hypothetical protein
LKILCVCDEGNKRSVVTRFLLNHSEHEALSVGANTNSFETMSLLCGWADVILLAEPATNIPMHHLNKVDTRFSIGPDVYPSSIDKKLYKLVKHKLIELGYI